MLLLVILITATQAQIPEGWVTQSITLPQCENRPANQASTITQCDVAMEITLSPPALTPIGLDFSVHLQLDEGTGVVPVPTLKYVISFLDSRVDMSGEIDVVDSSPVVIPFKLFDIPGAAIPGFQNPACYFTITYDVQSYIPPNSIILANEYLGRCSTSFPETNMVFYQKEGTTAMGGSSIAQASILLVSFSSEVIALFVF
eukprot:TRINITY_DN11413_c0_g1_i1.p1 TRINITY_DN11413_c0_g1~~TRINITY_DN11413_c0_g1_i1.p1  ORF type:complete len:221 (-),score=40.69 TRINITY_DN11413_c0_g1_i1:126-728(-)